MCEHFDSCIAVHKTGGPPTKESRRFELHLELCGECRGKAGLAWGSGMVKSQPADDVTFGRLRESLAEPDGPPARKGMFGAVIPRQRWLHNA